MQKKQQHFLINIENGRFLTKTYGLNMSGLNGLSQTHFKAKKEESVPFPDGEIMLSSFLDMDKRIHLF